MLPLSDKIFTLNLNGEIIDISTPMVMTIINATPDSFFSGSCKQCDSEIIASVERAINDGASILDIGGYSTRPGANEVSLIEEQERIVNTLKVINQSFGDIKIPISIDTFRAQVIEAAVDTLGKGVIVNDISAGEEDENMLPLVGKLSLPYIAMHKRGTPKTMGKMTNYAGDIVGEIVSYFVDKLALIRSYGIEDIVIDVGFGFAKNREQNFELLRRYSELRILGVPSLGGISRKRMVWESLDTTIEGALNGTSILNYKLLQQGASIIRVHDTKEASEVIKLYNLIG